MARYSGRILVHMLIYIFLETLLPVNSQTIDKQPFRVIGIYSICSNRPSINKTFDNTRAEIFHQSFLSWLHIDVPSHSELFKLYPGITRFNELINYEHYDVCDHSELLSKVISDVFLDVKYSRNVTNSNVYRPPDTDIVLVLSYVNQIDGLLLDGLLEMERNFPLVVLNPTNHRHLIDYHQASTQSVSVIKSNIENLKSQFEFFQWKHVGLIALIQHKDCIYYDYFEDVLKFLHESKSICFFAQYVNTSAIGFNMSTAIQNLKQELNVNVTILFGHPNMQYKFVKAVTRNSPIEGDRRIWVSHEMPYIPKDFTDVNYFISNVNILRKEQLFNFHIVKTFLNISHLGRATAYEIPPHRNEPELNKRTRQTYQESIGLFKRIMKVVYQNKDASKTLRLYKRVCNFLRNTIRQYYRTHLLVKIQRFETTFMAPADLYHNINPDNENNLELVSFKPKLRSPLCYSIVCPPGKTKVFGQITRNVTKWRYHHGWTCQSCPKNTVKSTTGNGPCLPCKGRLIPFKDQSGCFDPYKELHMKLSDTKVMLSLALSLFSLVVTVFILLVLVLHRNTPIGRIIDFKTSIFQLGVIVIFLCAVPLVLLLDRTFETCLLRIPILFPLYTAITSIILIKSQKILTAFNARVRISKRQSLVTSIKQISMVTCLSLGSLIIFGLVLLFEYPRIETLAYSSELCVEKHCLNITHVRFQIAFFISIHLACIVPAYRGRNLPSLFNEATPIIYLSFISIMSFLVLLGIEPFQRHQYSKDVTLWVVLTNNCVCVLLFLYGKKIYIIFFKPEKNTKDYLKNQTLASMAKRTNKRMARRVLMLGKINMAIRK